MGQEPQSTVSLYDFLYLDKKRIYTLLAQLSANGVQQSLKLSNSDKNGSSFETNVEGKGNVGIASFSSKGVSKTSDEASEIIESMHDVSWSSPLQLLDLLSEANLIHRGTEGAGIGSIVVVNGAARVFDVTSVKKAIPIFGPIFGAQMAELNPLLPPKAKHSKKNTSFENIDIGDGITIGMVMSMLDFVGDSLQVDFYEENGNATWMTLDNDGLTINSSDLALKYGMNIPGNWIVLGIVDALPDHYITDDTIIPDENPVKDGLYGLLEGIKTFIGRKPGSFGVTPLMVFRKTASHQ